MSFQPAQRTQLKLRICLEGLTGSGKTLGALLLAGGMTGENWAKVALIDTDNRSSLGYVGDPTWGIGQFLFTSLDAPYTPARYMSLMKEAVKAGAEVVIVDTMSQEWAGEGGVVEVHDAMGGNSFTNWRKAGVAHNELIEYITHQCPAHVIITLRMKMKHAISEVEENGYKKTIVERIGEGAIARPGTEYEFHLTLEPQRGTHRAEVITKRGSMLPDMRAVSLSKELGARLRAWAEEGVVSTETEEQGKRRLCRELVPAYFKDAVAMAAAMRAQDPPLVYTLEQHDFIRDVLMGQAMQSTP